MKTAAMLSPEPLPDVDEFAVRAPTRKSPERPPFPTAGKPYAKAKWEWVRQIALDTGLTSFQCRVGTYIALRHYPAPRCYACPTHKEIAEALGAKGKSGIKAAIDVLVARGHLYVEYSRGAGNANRYFLQRQGKLKEGRFPSDDSPKRYNGHVPF